MLWQGFELTTIELAPASGTLMQDC